MTALTWHLDADQRAVDAFLATAHRGTYAPRHARVAKHAALVANVMAEIAAGVDVPEGRDMRVRVAA